MTTPIIGQLYRGSEGTIFMLLDIQYGNPEKVTYLSNQRFFPGEDLTEPYSYRSPICPLAKIDYLNIKTKKRESIVIEENSFDYFFEELNSNSLF